MIWILLAISIVLMWLSFWFENDCNDRSSFVAAVLGVFIGLSAIFGAICLILNYPYNIDSKIKMYEEENIRIEEKTKNTVRVYMDFEKETYTNWIEESDLTTLMVAFPELNSNELVKTEIDLYIENSKKIKELKEQRLHRKYYRFWLYFGK